MQYKTSQAFIGYSLELEPRPVTFSYLRMRTLFLTAKKYQIYPCLVTVLTNTYSPTGSPVPCSRPPGGEELMTLTDPSASPVGGEICLFDLPAWVSSTTPLFVAFCFVLSFKSVPNGYQYTALRISSSYPFSSIGGLSTKVFETPKTEVLIHAGAHANLKRQFIISCYSFLVSTVWFKMLYKRKSSRRSTGVEAPYNYFHQASWLLSVSAKRRSLYKISNFPCFLVTINFKSSKRKRLF